MARTHFCPHCGEALPGMRIVGTHEPPTRLMPLDARLRAAFAWIAGEIREGGSPTFDEIREALDLGSRGAAQRRVGALIRLGWLVRRDGALAFSPFAAPRFGAPAERAAA